MDNKSTRPDQNSNPGISEQVIRLFFEFAESDQRIDRLKQSLKEMAARRELLKAETDAIKQETAQANVMLHDAKKAVDLLELELKSIADTLQQKQRKLASASSPKEYFSLEHEIQELEKKREPLDEQGLVLLNQLEESQKKYDSIKAEEPEKIAHSEQELDELTKTVVHNEQLLEALTKELQQLAINVPTELLAQYKAMKERVPNPVVPIVKASCSACFYALSKQDLADAQQGKLVTCKDCFRLVYFPQRAKEENEINL